MTKLSQKLNLLCKITSKWELFLLTCLLVVSCGNLTNNTQHTMHQHAEILSELQCQAKELQQKRFKLAEKKFMLEDSLLQVTDQDLIQDSIRKELDKITVEGELLQAKTRILADSIQSILNNWWKNEYRDTALRRHLDIILDSTFIAKCP